MFDITLGVDKREDYIQFSGYYYHFDETTIWIQGEFNPESEKFYSLTMNCLTNGEGVLEYPSLIEDIVYQIDFQLN